MTYAEYCAEKCEWCAKGVTYGYATTNGIYHKFQGVQYLCTAPSRDQFEQELQERIEELGGRLELANFGEDCLRRDLATATDRISELERENEELRKLMQEIACRCSWELQDRPGQHVSHIPGRRELQDALRSIRQQIESFDDAMRSAGEPRAKCPGCQASYTAKWAGTTCSNCDEIIAEEQKNG